MSLPGSDASVHQLVPPTERSFFGAHICICDCAEQNYGGRLAAALKNAGFHNPVVYTTLEELKKWIRGIGTEILFLNPHCHDCSEATLIATLNELNAFRSMQIVLLSDQPQMPEGRRRIRKKVALDRDALRGLMAELQPEWDRHQPKRMGGPHDGEFDREHKRY